MAKVVIGLSGGVDSSVAAYLLKEAGYEVIGLFMRNWHDESVTISDECPWVEDSQDALMVAQQLGIPFQTIDLSSAYKERIVNYMFDEYSSGRTPNPDVLCNREIKYDVFLKAALSLGADYVATGHYCQKATSEIDGKTIHHLLAGKDNSKDQSYFLCQLNQEQLAKALFPIGHLLKKEVREIADKIGLPTAKKKDSQGLCFVGKVKLPDFLKQQLKPKKGDIVEIDAQFYNNISSEDSLEGQTKPYQYTPESGKKIGEHQGAHFYTIGQRKGLGIGGTGEPVFIIDTDTVTNTIYVGKGENHPGLYRQGLFIKNKDIHWLREDLRLYSDNSVEYQCRIRYRQPLVKAVLHKKEEGLYITFEEKQRAVARGQFAAWYQKDELIGSGVID
jgi:tRNA-uridine 2-sulfurtransferase